MRGELYIKAVACAALLGIVGVGCKSNDNAGLTSIPSFAGSGNNTGGGSTNTGPGNGGNTGLPGGNPNTGGNNTTGTNVGGTDNGDPNTPLTIPENFQEQRDIFERVHFDYDSSELRPGDRDLVAQVAQHLIQNPQHMLLVEGHCDERGTEEYNLSLGERRALTVAEELVRLGVAADRLGTQSLGEKVPLSEADSKAARAQNRRGEFVLFMPMTGVVELPQN